MDGGGGRLPSCCTAVRRKRSHAEDEPGGLEAALGVQPVARVVQKPLQVVFWSAGPPPAPLCEVLSPCTVASSTWGLHAGLNTHEPAADMSRWPLI